MVVLYLVSTVFLSDGFLGRGTLMPSAALKSISCSCSCTMMARKISLNANSPIASAWRMRSRYRPTVSRSFSRSARSIATGSFEVLTGLGVLGVMSDTLQGLANGTYYFGVVGFDAAGNASPLSALVSAAYNATPPSLSITYGEPSPVGVGPLAMTLSSSKALAATPALTIQPGGASSPVLLSL